jgi:hypothetical protein
MRYAVRCWTAGHNPVGEAPTPDSVDHGLTVYDAVSAMAGHMAQFAHDAKTNVERHAFRMAYDFYDFQRKPSEHEQIITALEEGAREYGPAVQRHGKGALSHVTRGIEFWVMPCFDEDCTEGEDWE